MLVQRVFPTGSRVESWTVLGEDDKPVEAIERYLAYLSGIERSPNTVKAYAHDLKDYFVFLDLRGLDWREVRLEDLGEFVSWLRLPLAGRSGKSIRRPPPSPSSPYLAAPVALPTRSQWAPMATSGSTSPEQTRSG